MPCFPALRFPSFCLLRRRSRLSRYIFGSTYNSFLLDFDLHSPRSFNCRCCKAPLVSPEHCRPHEHWHPTPTRRTITCRTSYPVLPNMTYIDPAIRAYPHQTSCQRSLWFLPAVAIAGRSHSPSGLQTEKKRGRQYATVKIARKHSEVYLGSQ